MRLIDADKLHPDRMTDKGLAISQSQLAASPAISEYDLIKPYLKGILNKINSCIDDIDMYISEDEQFRKGMRVAYRDIQEYIESYLAEEDNNGSNMSN